VRAWRGLRASAALLLALAVLLPLPAAAQDEAAAVLERRIKAALLYRFINYVDWPAAAFPQPNSPFTIAILGADALAAELAEFAAGRTALGRPLVVRSLKPTESPADAQLVFVGAPETAQLGRIARGAPAHALIVSETDDALRQGGIINFKVVNGQVRFDVSLDAARKRSLRFSSRLLSAAHIVHGGN